MLCDSTQLWPQPTGPVTLGTTVAIISTGILRFETLSSPSQLVTTQLGQAYKIFESNLRIIEPQGVNEKTSVDQFIIKVLVNGSSETYLTLETDEGYSVIVKPEKNILVANIHAKSYFGARNALETLSQLIWSDENHGGALKILRAASVQDAPVFKYRGFMLDTARNYFPLEFIKKTIDGMAASKLNTFHWHISDSQSFPFLSDRVPQLAQNGAYSPDQVYTVSDVKEVVQYARVRGVRILIEVDTPGHSGSGWQWGPSHGLGELALCIDQQPWQAYCGEPPCGQLNPRNNHTYEVLEKIYRDIFELTHINDIFHFGGDEVNLDCWAQFFNMTDLHTLWGEFTNRAFDKIVRANGGHAPKVVIVWSSDLSKRPYLTQYFDKNIFVIQMWGGSTWPENQELLESDYRTLASHVDAWYLDCGFGSWREAGPGSCGTYKNWQMVYSHRPWAPETGGSRRLTIGGEACLWTEQTDSGTAHSKIWPRAAALAERLWSDPPPLERTVAPHDVYTRLQTHRERLVRRGIPASPLWPQWCHHNPALCLV
jgi:beta-hexosaminidase Fdl